MQVFHDMRRISTWGQTTAIVVATRSWYRIVREMAPTETMGRWSAEASLAKVGPRLFSSTPNV